MVSYVGFRIELNIRGDGYTKAHKLAEAILQKSSDFWTMLKALECSGETFANLLHVFRISLRKHCVLCCTVMGLAADVGVFQRTYQTGGTPVEKNKLQVSRRESYMDLLNVLGLFGYAIRKK